MRRTDLTRVEPGIYRTAGGHLVRVKGTDPRTGKPTERTELVEGGIAKARAKRRELREAIADADKPKPRTLSDYARSWLERKAPGISVATAERYAVSLEMHILPTLGDFYIHAITPDACVEWRDAAAKKINPRSGEPYGARTVNGWARVAKGVLGDACAELQLPSPIDRLRALPEPAVYSDEDPNLLDGPELGAFFAALPLVTGSFFPLLATKAITALRASELTALKWPDYNAPAGYLEIQRSHVRGNVRERTKTRRTRRVPVPPFLGEILEAHRQRLIRDQHPGLAAGWMFPSDEGTPRYGTTLAKPLKKALAVAGITRRLTPHGLRRTINDLLRLVANADVQKAITGHSTEAMREHYSHIRQHERAAAIAEVVQLMRKV